MGKQKDKKKKGLSLYRQTVIFICFIDLMFIFVMYCGYTTAHDIVGKPDPESFIVHYNIFCLVLFIFVAVVLATFTKSLLGRIRRGFNDLTEATRALSEGNTNVELDADTNDEFSRLIEEYMRMIDSTKKQEEVAEAVAAGDMTVKIHPRGENDVLGLSLKRMVESSDNSLSNIKDAAYQVYTSSSEVATASDSLAQGSTQQASAIEQITASITDLAGKTKENALEAANAAELMEKAVKNVEIGNSQMQDMMAAMKQINESSESISKIIKVIEDIAFQTNILALNAAVEASHAGELGRGFAVVAEEVRSLAAKSAQAASETTDLIEDSIHKVEAGTKIAAKTAKALEEITKGVQQSGQIITGIAEASNYQATAITQINQAIEQVSQVIQTNSATSEECAAASAELSNQSARMRELLTVYKLTDRAQQLPDFAQSAYSGPDSFGADSSQNEQIVSLGADFGKY